MTDYKRQHRLIRKRAVLDKTGFTATSTLYEAIRRHGFPTQIKIGNHSVAWDEAEVDAWIESRIAERDAKAGARP